MTSTFFRNDAPGLDLGVRVLLSAGAAVMRQPVLLVS
jgi:hypothetical protein